MSAEKEKKLKLDNFDNEGHINTRRAVELINSLSENNTNHDLDELYNHTRNCESCSEKIDNIHRINQLLDSWEIDLNIYEEKDIYSKDIYDKPIDDNKKHFNLETLLEISSNNNGYKDNDRYEIIKHLSECEQCLDTLHILIKKKGTLDAVIVGILFNMSKELKDSKNIYQNKP